MSITVPGKKKGLDGGVLPSHHVAVVLNPEKVPPEERTAVLEEYSLACEMTWEHGEASPPVLLMEAYI